jgi:Raf kinase inhibitor-like YbhB/YbcL family protein
MHHLLIFIYSFFPPTPLTIVSPDFPNDGDIPARFTCDGDGVSPTLIVNGIPEGTKTLALIVDNGDAADKLVTHWVVWNIKPMETILENTVPGNQGLTSAGTTKYEGLCPEQISQRYSFRVFALNTSLDFKSTPKRSQLDKAMEGHIIASGKLEGEYNRSLARTGKAKK